MTKEAQEYMELIWGYKSITLMDPVTASCILENHRENNPDWVWDAELWNEYAQLHNIPVDITYVDITYVDFFTKYLHKR